MFNRKHSSGRLFESTVLVMVVLGLCIPTAWPDSTTFKESQKDSLDCTPGGGCDEFTSGNFTMRGSFFTDVNLVEHEDLLTKETELDITVGDWNGSVHLGDDPHYRNGKRNATIKLIDSNSCKNKDVTHGTIKFSGSAHRVRITVSTKTGSTACDEYELSAIADDHAGETNSFSDTVPVSMDISNNVDELSTSTDVPVTGRASIKDVTKQGTPYELDTVKVHGSN